MAKVGIELRINLSKIEKARIYEGAKGKYLTMTTFVDLDNKDQYENNGFIAHKKEKDEQGNPPILGNAKVFWSDTQQQTPYQQQPQAPQPQQPQQPSGFDDFDDDIPF